jgi:predicted amidohydrolase YtcJ
MLADFVVLEENPFEVPANQIKDIPIVATYLGGQKIFG